MANFKIELNGCYIGIAKEVELDTDYIYVQRNGAAASGVPVTHRVILSQLDFGLDIRHGCRVHMQIVKPGSGEPRLDRDVISNRDFGFKDEHLEFYWFEADDDQD